MIKEAYCSFEVAKLLKEKGFDELCYMSYWLRTKDSIEFVHLEQSGNNYSDCLFAPTHQMAMKWLREVKGLFIAINCDDLNYNWQVFDVHHRDKNGEPICQSESFGGYYNFEKATDDAIKYCLEKLIL